MTPLLKYKEENERADALSNDELLAAALRAGTFYFSIL
jgi:hypothetical protein